MLYYSLKCTYTFNGLQLPLYYNHSSLSSMFRGLGFFTLCNSDGKVVHVVFMHVKCKMISVGVIGVGQGAVTMATRQERVNSCKLERHAAPSFASVKVRNQQSLFPVPLSPLLLPFSCFLLPPLIPFSFSFSPPLSFYLAKDRVDVNNSCFSSLRQKCDTCTHTHLKRSDASGTW